MGGRDEIATAGPSGFAGLPSLAGVFDAFVFAVKRARREEAAATTRGKTTRAGLRDVRGEVLELWREFLLLGTLWPGSMSEPITPE